MEKLNSDWVPFSYPYGAGVTSSPARQYLQNNGYACAVTSGGYFGNNPTTDLWSLKRIRIDAKTDYSKFKSILSGTSDIGFLRFAYNEFIDFLRSSRQ